VYYVEIMEPETEFYAFGQDVERITHGKIHVLSPENLRDLASSKFGKCKYVTFRGNIFFVPENADLLHIDVWNDLQQIFADKISKELPIDSGTIFTKGGMINFTKGPAAGDSLLQLIPKEKLATYPIFNGKYFNDKEVTLVLAENIQSQAHADDILIVTTP